MRYSITERYDFGSEALQTLTGFINPFLPKEYTLPNGLMFDSRASSIEADENRISLGFGSGREQHDGLRPKNTLMQESQVGS